MQKSTRRKYHNINVNDQVLVLKCFEYCEYLFKYVLSFQITQSNFSNGKCKFLFILNSIYKPIFKITIRNYRNLVIHRSVIDYYHNYQSWSERSACDSGANVVTIINGVIFPFFFFCLAWPRPKPITQFTLNTHHHKNF